MEGSILTAWVAPHHKEMTHMFRFRPVACPWGEPNTIWWWWVEAGLDAQVCSFGAQKGNAGHDRFSGMENIQKRMG